MKINFLKSAKWQDTEHTSLYVKGLFDASKYLTDLTLNKDDEEDKELFDQVVLNYSEQIEEFVKQEEFIIPSDLDVLSEKVENYIRRYLNQIAQEKSYDLGVTLATYYHSTIPKFQEEASKYIEFRDKLWNAWFSIQEELTTVKSIPTSQEVIERLPTFTW